MLNLLTIGGVVASLLVAPAAAANPAATTDGRAVVDIVTANGSGCPAGTTKVNYSADHGSVIVYFNDFRALSGGGSSATEARTNCQLAIHVQVPAGFTYTVDRTDLFGYAELGSGAKGSADTNYYFQGSSDNTSVDHSFTGPTAKNWQTTDAPASAGLGYLPCGEDRYLNVNIQLRASGGASNAISYLSADTFVLNSESIRWTKC